MSSACGSHWIAALCAAVLASAAGEAADVLVVANAPDDGCWDVQDPEDPDEAAVEVRLLQTDVKVSHLAPPDGPAAPLNPAAPAEVVASANGLNANANKQVIAPLLLPTAMPWGGSKRDVRGISKTSKETAGGLRAFTHGTVGNFLLCMLCLVVFGFLRLWYPRVYAANVLKGLAPMVPPLGYFGWIRGSLRVNTEQTVMASGLDAGMLLEFCNLCMKILVTMGLPQVIVLCPLHFFYGRGDPDGDLLSTISMGNVMDRHPWFHWVQAVAMWCACLVTEAGISVAVENFLRHRLSWLKERPAPAAATVIMDGSPMAGCTQADWKAFYYRALSRKRRREGTAVRSSEDLASMVRQGNSGGSAPGSFTMIRGIFLGQDIGCVTCQEKQLTEIEQLTAFEWAWAHKEDPADPAQASPLGVAAYYKSRETEIAQGLRFDPDGDEIVIYVSQALARRIWEEDLMPEKAAARLSVAAWYVTASLIFLLAVPACGAAANLGYLADVGVKLQPVWTAFAPPAVLLAVLSMATPLLAFSRGLFLEMKPQGWSQHAVFAWSFWFHFVMLIPVTVLSRLAVVFFEDLVTESWSVFKVLSIDVPQSTDFYLNFTVLLWFYHGFSLIRCMPLRTLVSSRATREDEKPHMQAEELGLCSPVAVRSAQWTVHMLICIVFCTVSPLLSLLGFVNFALCRLVYGYLIVFAEAKRRDLGGAFFISQLKLLQFGVMVYIIVMVLMMSFRSPSWGPILSVLPILGHTCWKFARFCTLYDLEKMPFTEVDLPRDLLAVARQEPSSSSSSSGAPGSSA